MYKYYIEAHKEYRFVNSELIRDSISAESILRAYQTYGGSRLNRREVLIFTKYDDPMRLRDLVRLPLCNTPEEYTKMFAVKRKLFNRGNNAIL